MVNDSKVRGAASPQGIAGGWAAKRAEETFLLGRAPLIVLGDSAGANLATVAARHHHGLPDVRHNDLQVLVYPVTDARFDTASYLGFAEGKLLTRADMQWFRSHYVPDVSTRRHHDASPLRSQSLATSPAALVLTAALDPLRDEGEAYAAALARSGVSVDLVRCEGLVQGFLSMIQLIPEAAAAFDQIADAIEKLQLRWGRQIQELQGS